MLIDHYQDKPEKYFHSARQEMISFILGSVSTILEIGYGDGAFGAALKQQCPVPVTGIEPFSEAPRIAASRIDKVISTDIETGLKALLDHAFDCFVCNDVLEHLVAPWDTVRRLRDHIHLGGYFVASVPNVRHFEVMNDLVIHGNWRYTEEGVLDRTHLRFFTQHSIRALFENADLKVITLQGLNGGPYPREFALQNRMLFNRLDEMRWMQFACVSQRVAR